MQSHQKRRKSNAILIVIVLMLVITLVLTRGFTYARYASNAVFNYYLSSQGFYFDSEELSYDTKNNVDTMWDGEKVYFTLSNSANEALASERTSSGFRSAYSREDTKGVQAV